MTNSRPASWLLLGAVAACLLTTSWLAKTVMFPRQHGEDGARVLPLPHTGEELLAVFIGSSGCAASRDERLPLELGRIRAVLDARASRQGMTFRVIGVSLDASSEAGLRFLREFGEFDEVIAGGGWLNSGGIQYLWRDLTAQPALPQLVVLEREIVATGDRIEVRHERVINRIVGIAAMREWDQLGVTK